MKTLSAQLSNISIQVGYLLKALGLVWDAAPRWTTAWLALLLLQGIIPGLILYLTRAVVDSLVIALDARGDWSTIQPALWLVAWMFILMGLSVVLDSLNGWVVVGQSELVKDYISTLIHQQAITLDLGFYENSEFYNLLERARTDAASQPLELLRNLGSLAQNGITLVAIAWVVLPYGIWIPMLLALSTLPAFLSIVHHTRLYNDWRERTTYDRRRAQYYEYLLTYPWPAAEMRLYSLGQHFDNAFQSIRQRLRSENLALLRNKSLAELATGMLALLGMGVAMAWMGWQAISGAVTLGDLVLFYQAFTRGQGLAGTLLRSTGQIYRNILFVANLFEFLALQPQVHDSPHPQPMPTLLRKGITFERVSFRYPGTHHQALSDFSLHFPAGKITAIVGANGAGKSTLIKLIGRFYDAQVGQITVDGIELRQIRLHELRRQITLMFQNPVHYAATAGENIALGDLHMQPSQAQIEAAARASAADVSIARLPAGYDTMLSNWFGGVELSGGEWQRVAQARAFLRQASIVILDEPTSAMDSWAEGEWLARFRTLVAGRTAIIITHRFTTAMHADTIHVMDHGQVIESGTHDELCALGGRYAESWRKQMRSTGTTDDGTISNGHPVVTHMPEAAD